MTNTGRTILGGMMLAISLLGMPAAGAAELAPRFDLPALDGRRYTDRDLLGRPTLVVFWASWCPVCQVELPKLHALFDAERDRGLQVLAIGFADDADEIRRYVQAHAEIFDFPVLYDSEDRVAKRFGVIGTPTIFLLNRDGEIEHVTWLSEDPALGKKLQRLLTAPQTSRSRVLNSYRPLAGVDPRRPSSRYHKYFPPYG